MEELAALARVFVEIFQISSVSCQSAECCVLTFVSTQMHSCFLLWLSNLARFPFFSSFHFLVIGIVKTIKKKPKQKNPLPNKNKTINDQKIH